MPDIFKQAMENNSRNEKCVTGGALMFGGKYSEYALAVNMKKDADLEPEDQELCESRTIVTNIVCKKRTVMQAMNTSKKIVTRIITIHSYRNNSRTVKYCFLIHVFY